MGYYLPGPAGVVSPGVAPDGLKGQYLRKASDLDFDTEWVDVSLGLAPVTSVAGRTGDITLTVGDVSGALSSATAAATYSPLVHGHSWSQIGSTPTTLSGYGITDGITAATAAATYSPLNHVHDAAYITGLQYSPRTTITASSGVYTIDVTAGAEFVTNAAIAATTTINLSNLSSIPASSVWRGVLRFAYSSGTINWFAGNSGYTVKWDGNSAITPTAGETECVVIEVYGTTIEVAALRGRT